MEIEEKLHQLQKKYPQTKLRALVIKNSDLNFTLSALRCASTLSIEGSAYKGILFQRVTINKEKTLNPKALTVELVVGEKEFLTSGNLALYLIKKYGIPN